MMKKPIPKSGERFNEELYLFSGSYNTIFDPKYCGITLYDPNYSINNPGSIAYTFEYIIDGEGTLIHKGQKYYPKTGDIYILHAFNDHRYYTNPDNPWKKIFFVAEGSLIGNILLNFGLSNIIHIPNFNNSEYFTRLLECASSSPNRHNPDIFLLFSNFIISISQFIDEQNSTLPEKIKNYIDNNIDRKITISDICDYTKYSQAQICRIFKDTYNIPLYDYLLQKKLRIAKKYLLETSIPIFEISERLSFNSPAHFSSFIKSATGKTPTEIRKS